MSERRDTGRPPHEEEMRAFRRLEIGVIDTHRDASEPMVAPLRDLFEAHTETEENGSWLQI
jgi:hypothetical protein